MNFPQEFKKKMKQLLGEEYPQFESSMEQPPWKGIRVNTLKISPEEWENISPFPVSRVPWENSGFYCDEKAQPSRHPYYSAGLYYIQEPSAMSAAATLPVCPGDKVLDLCAAPGGKSTKLGAALNGTGLLVSNDISSARAKALVKNIEMAGIKNSVVLSCDPKDLTLHFHEYFDKILIDAPCSGEGMFRRDGKGMSYWETYGPAYYANIQKQTVKAGISMLKPGGSLLYSTCTFSPEENEQVVEYMLDLDDSLQIIPIVHKNGIAPGRPQWSMTKNEALAGCARLWPHKIKGEGHFLALLSKGKPDDTKKSTESLSGIEGDISLEAQAFLMNLKGLSGCYHIKNDWISDFGIQMPDLSGLHILKQGVLLGQMKKKRFEPAQGLALALKSHQFSKCLDLPVKDERILRYLKGETLSVPEVSDGMVLVCVDGFPLGWGKVSKKRLKNKYAPGWRWQ